MARIDGSYRLDCYECSAKNIEKNIEEQRQVVKNIALAAFGAGGFPPRHSRDSWQGFPQARRTLKTSKEKKGKR